MNILLHKETIQKAYNLYTEEVHKLRSVLNGVVGKTVNLYGDDSTFVIKSTFVAIQDRKVLIEIEVAPEKHQTNFNYWRKVEDTRINWDTMAD
jgi:hypothetical protein